MEAVDFHDFLDRMRNPAAADLVRSIKSFIIDLSSRPPNPENDSKSVQEFMTTMEGTFKGHPLWAGATPEELDSAGEGLEKYLMTKLYSRTFASVPEEAEHDQRVYEKMHLLQQFMRPEHLDIPPKFQNETSWLLAQKEILKINTYKNPRDKLQCILNCSTVILNVSMAADENPPGADEFLPVLIYVIVKANPPQLYSNLLFITRYRLQSRLVSEAAYFYTNLVSAETFIENLNAESLSMDDKEFERKMLSARETLNATTNIPHVLDIVSEQVPTQAAESLDAQTVSSRNGSSSIPSEAKMSVQRLQASGATAVVEADKAGHLAREYPFLYASVGDLRIEDVETLLNDYKELVLKYYALHKAVERSTVTQQPASMGRSRGGGPSASAASGWESSRESLEAQQVVSGSSKDPVEEDRLDRQKVPETEEVNQDSASLHQVADSDEMSDKNVILVNEDLTSRDKFLEQSARANNVAEKDIETDAAETS